MEWRRPLSGRQGGPARMAGPSDALARVPLLPGRLARACVSKRPEPMQCAVNESRIDSGAMSTTRGAAPTLEPSTRVQYLPGVGPQRALAFERLGIMSLEHLVRHYPRTWLDASRFVK